MQVLKTLRSYMPITPTLLLQLLLPHRSENASTSCTFDILQEQVRASLSLSSHPTADGLVGQYARYMTQRTPVLLPFEV